MIFSSKEEGLAAVSRGQIEFAEFNLIDLLKKGATYEEFGKIVRERREEFDER